MSRVDNEILFNQLNWRYACKKFDPSMQIREADWNLLAESLRLAPSSYGLQPWKFILVQNPELRQQLMAKSWGQTPVVDCSHFVVIATMEKIDEAHIDKFVKQTADIRHVDAATLEGYKNVMVGDLVKGPRSQIINFWAQRQAYIAMGFLMANAALMEIDTLAMEGLVPEEYDKILGLGGATGWKTVAAVACGYRATDDKYQHAKKVRFEMKDILEVR
jgi:nitroreductase